MIGEEKTFDMKSRIKGILLAAAVVLVGVCTFGIWQKVQKDTEEEKTPETVTIRLFPIFRIAALVRAMWSRRS